MQQSPSTIFMVRPQNFGFNKETAVSNGFQNSYEQTDSNEKALKEFDAMVQLLRDNQVDVIVFEDTIEPVKPDAIFPNNWISI